MAAAEGLSASPIILCCGGAGGAARQIGGRERDRAGTINFELEPHSGLLSGDTC